MCVHHHISLDISNSRAKGEKKRTNAHVVLLVTLVEERLSHPGESRPIYIDPSPT